LGDTNQLHYAKVYFMVAMFKNLTVERHTLVMMLMINGDWRNHHINRNLFMMLRCPSYKKSMQVHTVMWRLYKAPSVPPDGHHIPPDGHCHVYCWTLACI